MKKHYPFRFVPGCIAFLLQLIPGSAVAQSAVARETRDARLYRTKVNYENVVKSMRVYRNPTGTGKPAASTFQQVAMLYTTKNIYPTKSSVALVYSLNPGLTTDQPLSAGTRLVSPNFTEIPTQLLQASMEEYARLKLPDASTNDSFAQLSNTLARELPKLYKTLPPAPGFHDSTQHLVKSILPGIASAAAGICQAQMRYFNLELGHIIELVNHLSTVGAAEPSIIYSIEQMIGDLMEITGWNEVPSESPGARATPAAGRTATPSAAKKTRIDGNYAFYEPVQLDPLPAFSPWNNPPNAAIYVFRNKPGMEPDSLPAMKAFDVYYDCNGYIYSLTPGCDTLQFFSIHPRNPASTLPVTLGKGNYCFVLKDRRTGKLYLQPDVNLAVNRDYDEQQRVIIPFYIEED